MDFADPLLTNGLLVAAVIALLLVAAAVLWSGRNKKDVLTAATIAAVLKPMLAELGEAARENFDISAVLELTQKVTGRPEVLERLREYGRDIAVAVLVFRLEAVARDIQCAQTALTDRRKKIADGQLSQGADESCIRKLAQYQAEHDELRKLLAEFATA